MEIRVHGPGEEPRPLAVTMRTPGSDFELAVGFLLAEGLLSGPADLDTVAYCVGPEGIQQYNVVTVRLRAPVGDRLRARNVLTTSACGVCGAASIDDIATHAPPVGSGPEVRTEVLHGLTEVLGGAQRAFGATGGVHAAARFGPTGDLRAVRETSDAITPSTSSSATRPSPERSRSPTTCSSCRGASRSNWSKRRPWPAFP